VEEGDIKEGISLTWQEYSLSKEVIKDDERGWYNRSSSSQRKNSPVCLGPTAR
jgi:hypothetical protein